MTFGQKIKKLRTDAGLTQKDLAEQMNVSFQTVSKWESDTNEPDINSIKKLSKIFNCSFEYLLGDDNEEPKEEILEELVTSEDKVLGRCRDCGKELHDGDLVHNVERISSSGVKEMVTICDDCFNKHEEEVQKRLKEINASTYELTKPKPIKGPFKEIRSRDDSKVLIWSIVIGIISFIVTLVVGIIYNQQLNIGWVIGLPFIVGYVLLADIYCIFSDTWISDIFLEIASWSIKTPGIIFTFDLDGLKFLIAMKILFWLLGIIVGIGVLLLALSIASLFSIFAFPFMVIKK